MKKILILGLLFYGLCTQAKSYDSGYFNFNVGLNVNLDFGVDINPRVLINYGTPIAPQKRYMGFFEMGLKAPSLMIAVKYGYEWMRHSQWSVGLDTNLLLGLPPHNEEHGYNFDNMTGSLGLGNEVAAFATIKITNTIAALLRIGVQHNTTFSDFAVSQDNLSLFADVGARWHL